VLHRGAIERSTTAQQLRADTSALQELLGV